MLCYCYTFDGVCKLLLVYSVQI